MSNANIDKPELGFLWRNPYEADRQKTDLELRLMVKRGEVGIGITLPLVHYIALYKYLELLPECYHHQWWHKEWRALIKDMLNDLYTEDEQVDVLKSVF